MEAILAEYGHGKSDEPGKDFNERAKMFNIDMLMKYLQPNGGWTTEGSFKGLVRRVLHALITNDTFTVVLGGHSAAAGHGNLFIQSYIMQFHKVTEPVLALLGVTLHSHNICHGGLGTLQNSLGAKDLYGDEVDILIWDSGMTENRDNKAVDIFARQGLIGGNRVPFLMGGHWGDLKFLNEEAGADVGEYGEGLDGIPTCKDEVDAEKVVYAARYMKCDKERQDMCNKEKFHSNCWVNRTDVTPPLKQDEKPGSQVGWHPGFRSHQIIGRVLSFWVLKALKEAISIWKNADNYVVPDKDWHVADYYANIQKKVKSLDKILGSCYEFSTALQMPERLCTTPINARTEFTPRPNPEKTSLQSIIKPNELGYVPHVSEPLFFTGPNVFNPFIAIPEDAVDVLAIVSNGRNLDTASRRLEKIEPGLGWQMQSTNGYCDGSWNSECGRSAGSTCLILGHNDGRGGILFGSYSGWLVMTLKDVTEGIILTKIETWHLPSELSMVNGWKSENNKIRNLRHGDMSSNFTTPARHQWVPYEASDRQLKVKPPEYCDKFQFQFAIDGKITSWDKDQFAEKSKNPQRVVEIQTLLDDPNFTSKPKDVELAIRMVGCGDTTKKTFKLTHVYWA
eukprot:CAMPEP_0116846898 /NCGR_PEP_ID=MMETSP0418-20121206/14120_1 /TAXON_ID=1158023 /ORGANISM="Astrosyne radiata, Strain 13vi08-1A" /LENGTH=620 /DNA_ID=CAMNT_0004478255 /DNA_START=23 /DNA_END=1886 /DNA_ORIENTATION=-